MSFCIFGPSGRYGQPGLSSFCEVPFTGKFFRFECHALLQSSTRDNLIFFMVHAMTQNTELECRTWKHSIRGHVWPVAGGAAAGRRLSLHFMIASLSAGLHLLSPPLGLGPKQVTNLCVSLQRSAALGARNVFSSARDSSHKQGLQLPSSVTVLRDRASDPGTDSEKATESGISRTSSRPRAGSCQFDVRRTTDQTQT